MSKTQLLADLLRRTSSRKSEVITSPTSPKVKNGGASRNLPREKNSQKQVPIADSAGLRCGDKDAICHVGVTKKKKDDSDEPRPKPTA